MIHPCKVTHFFPDSCSVVNDYSSSLQFKRRIIFFVASFIGSIILFVISFYDAFFFNDPSDAMIHGIIGGLMLLNILLFYGFKRFEPGIAIFLGIILLLYGLTLYRGMDHAGGILWFFLYPVLVFSLNDCLRSVVWISIFFFLLGVALILHENYVFMFSRYTSFDVIRLFPVLIPMSMVAFIIEFLNCLSMNNLTSMRRKEKEKYSHVQLDLAEKIQRSLIPAADIIADEYDIAFYYKAAYGVGGDYLDYFEIDEHRIGLVTCDVVGKGVPAALMMVSVRTVIKSMIAEGLDDPEYMIDILNGMIHSDYGDDFYVTMAFIVYDTRDNSIRFYNAGHSPFIYYSDIEKRIKEIELKAYPIGMFARHTRKKYITERLYSGDVVLLFSDGLTECIDSRNTLRARSLLFQELVEHSDLSAGEIKEGIVEKFIRSAEDSHTKDDISLTILKVKSRAAD